MFVCVVDLFVVANGLLFESRFQVTSSSHLDEFAMKASARRHHVTY